MAYYILLLTLIILMSIWESDTAKKNNQMLWACLVMLSLIVKMLKDMT